MRISEHIIDRHNVVRLVHPESASPSPSGHDPECPCAECFTPQTDAQQRDEAERWDYRAGKAFEEGDQTTYTTYHERAQACWDLVHARTDAALRRQTRAEGRRVAGGDYIKGIMTGRPGESVLDGPA